MSKAPATAATAVTAKRYLIVNADDAGYCTSRDSGIFDCMKHGIVTSTSLLANGLSSSAAAKYLSALTAPPAAGTVSSTAGSAPATHASAPHAISVGLHFNLTEGKYLSKPELEMSGKFGFWELALKSEQQATAPATATATATAAATATTPTTADNKSALELNALIESELRAQIEWFRVSFGGRLPSHIDGHNHIHVIPAVARVMSRVMREYGITRTRIPTQPPPPLAIASAAGDSKAVTAHTFDVELSPFLRRVVEYSTPARAVYAACGVHSTTAMIGMRMQANATATLSNVQIELESTLQSLAAAGAVSSAAPSAVVIEWMSHPGFASALGTGDDFSQSPDRDTEQKLLSSAELHRLITHSLNLALVSFTAAPLPTSQQAPTEAATNSNSNKGITV